MNPTIPKLKGNLWSNSYQKTQELVLWDNICLINKDVFNDCDDIIERCKVKNRIVTLK